MYVCLSVLATIGLPAAYGTLLICVCNYNIVFSVFATDASTQ